MIVMSIADSNGILYQWDTGQRVLVAGASVGDRADFSIGGTGPLSVALYEDGGRVYADIPNILLQTAGDIAVYICTAEGTEQETIAARTFRVYARPKPEDYVYTETEVLTYSALESRVSALEQGGGGSGGSGTPGKDGGYYVPAVSQESSDSMTMSWKPSAEEMPEVDPTVISLPSGGGGGEWKLLGEYTFTPKDRKFKASLSQFDATHFRILAEFPKTVENVAPRAYLGTSLNQATNAYATSTYATALLAECELFNGQLYGYIGFIDGWANNHGAVVARNTPRDSKNCDEFSIYYPAASDDETENIVQIWGY